MIKFVTNELLDFAKWLELKYPCSVDVLVTEVHSLSGYEVDKHGKPNKKSMFKNGVAVYLEGMDEIYIADPMLTKSLIGGDISEFKGFENYTMSDYLLETFAHEYKHHLQKYSNKDINEDDAEIWCKDVYEAYKKEFSKGEINETN